MKKGFGREGKKGDERPKVGENQALVSKTDKPIIMRRRQNFTEKKLVQRKSCRRGRHQRANFGKKKRGKSGAGKKKHKRAFSKTM